MNLLLDESLGLKELSPVINSFNTMDIKPMTIGKNNQQLSELIETQKKKKIKKELNPQSQTISDEIHLIMNFFTDTSTLYYLYDPKITSQSSLQRIRQWLLPTFRLNFSEASTYQAETLYMIDRMTNGYGASNMPLNNTSLERQGRLFIITPKVKPFVKAGQQYRIFPSKEYSTYKLIEKNKGKWSVHQVGQWWDLMNLVKAYQTDEEHCWMTYQGLDPFENQGTLNHVTTQELHPYIVPGNLPHIQMFLSKKQAVNSL